MEKGLHTFAPLPQLAALIHGYEPVQQQVVFVRTWRTSRRGWPRNFRRGRLGAGVITVFVHTDGFADGPQYYKAGTHTLVYPTDSTQELLRCALSTMERIFREGFNFRYARPLFTTLESRRYCPFRLRLFRLNALAIANGASFISVARRTSLE
jgi:hypothetical protein